MTTDSERFVTRVEPEGRPFSAYPSTWAGLFELLRDFEWSDRLDEAKLVDLAEFLLVEQHKALPAPLPKEDPDYEYQNPAQREQLALDSLMEGLQTGSILNPSFRSLSKGLRTLGLTDIPDLTEEEEDRQKRVAVETRATARAQFYRMAALTGQLGDTPQELDQAVAAFKQTYDAFLTQEGPEALSFEGMARDVLITGFEAKPPLSLAEQEQRRVARQQREQALDTGISVAQRQETQFDIPEEQAGGPAATEPIGGERLPVQATRTAGPSETPAQQVLAEARQTEQFLEQQAREFNAGLTDEQIVEANVERGTQEATRELLGGLPPEEQQPFAAFLQSRLPQLRSQQQQSARQQFEALSATGRNLPFVQQAGDFGQFLRERAEPLFKEFVARKPPAPVVPEEERSRAARPSLIFTSRR